MCYRCATNPSIHHHRRHIAAMSSPLSHHGVAFTLVVVSSSPSQCHLCRRIVAVSSSPSWCCLRVCHGFVIAVTVLPSHRSWFCHCRHQKKSTFLTTSYYILSHLIPLILGVRKE